MAQIVGEILGEAAGETGGSIWRSYHTRDRILLATGSILSYIAFWLMGKAFSIPQVPHFAASLLGLPAPLLAIFLTLLTLVGSVVVATFIARIVHFEAGLFCAAIGILALSIRGGPMRYVLMYASGPGIYARLLSELLMLAVCIAIGWWVLMLLRDWGILHGEPLRDDDPDALPGQGAMALAATVILMIFLMLLLAQTDKKAQVIWSIVISSCVATLASHSLFPSRPSIWFWTAPIIVGAIGYFVAWMGGQILVGGGVGGMLPQLARPLPLDYAGAGTAGSLLGYWTSRKWLHEREGEPHTTGEVEEALEQQT